MLTLFSPEIELLAIAVSITVVFGIISSILREKMLGKEKLNELKSKQAEIMALMKKSDKESQKRLKELNNELVEMNMQLMKAIFPIILISIVVMFFLWPVLSERYAGHDFPIVKSWVWYYLLVSVITSTVLQRIMIKLGRW